MEKYKNKIIQGDCLEVMKTIADKSIDLVITDPPYKTEFLPLYGQMAKECGRIMKDGALLITLCGQFAINRIIKNMDEYLTFYWIGGMPNSAGSVARNFHKQIMCSWKPALWYSKGKVKDHQFVFDLFQTKRIERVNHKWEQPIGWFEYYIEKLTREGDIIMDPFAGSGTTLLASKMLKRNYIGIEINPEYCKIAEQRLAQQVLI